MRRIASALLLSLALGAQARGEMAPTALDRFEAELKSRDSATAVLQSVCDRLKLAPGQAVVARREAADDVAGPAERVALGVGPEAAVRHRRVRLACGDHVLSVADNWYLPGRLTPGMNRRLEETDTPFGVVAAPLDFRRRTLSSVRPTSGATVLENRAVLTTPDGRPFSLVVERYTGDVLAPER